MRAAWLFRPAPGESGAVGHQRPLCPGDGGSTLLPKDAAGDPGERGTWTKRPTKGLVWGGGGREGSAAGGDGGPWHPRRRAPAACGAGSPRPPGDSFTSVCPSPKSKGVGALEDIGGENRPKNPDSHIVLKNGKIRPRWVWRFTGLRVAGPGSRPHLQTGAGGPRHVPGGPPRRACGTQSLPCPPRCRVRFLGLGLSGPPLFPWAAVAKSTTDGFRNTHSFVMPREAGRPRRRRFPMRGLRVHFPARGRCPHAGSGARALSGGPPQKPALAPSTTAPPRGRVSSRGPRLRAP